MARTQLHFGLLALLMLLVPARSFSEDLGSDGSPAFTTVPELSTGFNLLYVQKFPQAREKFRTWESQHPDEPFGEAALAASYLYEEFYRQGVLSSDFFLDDKRFLRGIKNKPNPERMRGFHNAVAEARKVAKERLREHPNDAEALFVLTLVAGMEADADSILLKEHMDSLKRVKEANQYAKELLVKHPDANDAYVAVGSANYIIGCLSGGTRFVLWFGGIHGDKKRGMEQLEKAADNGRYLRPFAKILLALAARREKQNVLAQKLLEDLTREYPESPLFASEYAKLTGRPAPAQMSSR